MVLYIQPGLSQSQLRSHNGELLKEQLILPDFSQVVTALGYLVNRVIVLKVGSGYAQRSLGHQEIKVGVHNDY